MVTETPNDCEPLLPVRHEQRELFLCDISDAVLKDDMASMEHPFYALAKRRDFRPRKYEHNGATIMIIPSSEGMATIYDKDILIYCISQIMAALNEGRRVYHELQIVPRDLLIFTNRNTGGKDYEALRGSLRRLSETRIRTNIETDDTEQETGFGLIEKYRIERNKQTGRIEKLEVTLADWLFRAISNKKVLSLHPDYFRLRKPLERRIYEIARKHCGSQSKWEVGMSLLQKKCGSSSPLKHFRYIMRDLVKHDHLPDYAVEINEKRDVVIFTKRKPSKKTLADCVLHPDTYVAARAFIGSVDDPYAIEQAWRCECAKQGWSPTKDPDSAFLSYCQKRRNILTKGRRQIGLQTVGEALQLPFE